jgi:hypothetical protein
VDREALAALATLAERLRTLATEARLVLVSGLPGTGKSLVIRELARDAAAAGRTVHTLQWDVARPAFEAAPAGRRYPLADGVTHVVIRKAAGLWVRGAVASWHAANPHTAHVLIGELPLVGGRFIELARPVEDAAELVLGAPSCRFVIPVPSRDVRAFVEAERDRRMANPVHPREREDAPSPVLRALWDDLVGVARTLALPVAPAGAGGVAYDPAVYEAVYRHVLARRHPETLPLERLLPVGGSSAYDLAVPIYELAPSEPDAARAIQAVEASYPDLERLSAEMERWYSAP